MSADYFFLADIPDEDNAVMKYGIKRKIFWREGVHPSKYLKNPRLLKIFKNICKIFKIVDSLWKNLFKKSKLIAGMVLEINSLKISDD